MVGQRGAGPEHGAAAASRCPRRRRPRRAWRRGPSTSSASRQQRRERGVGVGGGGQERGAAARPASPSRSSAGQRRSRRRWKPSRTSRPLVRRPAHRRPPRAPPARRSGPPAAARRRRARPRAASTSASTRPGRGRARAWSARSLSAQARTIDPSASGWSCTPQTPAAKRAACTSPAGLRPARPRRRAARVTTSLFHWMPRRAGEAASSGSSARAVIQPTSSTPTACAARVAARPRRRARPRSAGGPGRSRASASPASRGLADQLLESGAATAPWRRRWRPSLRRAPPAPSYAVGPGSASPAHGRHTSSTAPGLVQPLPDERPAGRPPRARRRGCAGSRGRRSEDRQHPVALEGGDLAAVVLPLGALVAQEEVEDVLAQRLGEQLAVLGDRRSPRSRLLGSGWMPRPCARARSATRRRPRPRGGSS